jgi:cytosine/adenosine deaminase-related metal-dependent hydrolase
MNASVKTGGNDYFIKDAAVFMGPELEFHKSTNISVVDGKIIEMGAARRTEGQKVLSGKEMLVMPGLVNAHVHLNDAPLKDAGAGRRFEEIIHPVTGLKVTGLRSLTTRERVKQMSKALEEMVRSGITQVVDFHEEDVSIIDELRRFSSNSAILTVLGRPPRYFSTEEIISNTGFEEREMRMFRKDQQKLDGSSLSGANEYSNRAMEQINDARKGITGVHAAESANAVERSVRITGETEVERLSAYLKPDFLVHMTNATEADIDIAASSRLGIVCCPRSNAILGVGIPPVSRLVDAGLDVALGTDNIMVNSPDIFREMDFAARIARGSVLDPSTIPGRDALKMATINGTKIFGKRKEPAGIVEGARADLAIISMQGNRLSGTHDIYSAIVHRAGPADVLGTMKSGRLLYRRNELRME